MADARIVEKVEKPTGKSCSAVHNDTQSSAMGYLDGAFIYVQFDRLDHPQAHGWWKYPAEDFEILFVEGERP